MTLSPNNAEAHWVLGTALPLVGRLPDAIDAMRKAMVLDPLRAEYERWVARFLLYQGTTRGPSRRGTRPSRSMKQSIADPHLHRFGQSRHGRRGTGTRLVPAWPGHRQGGTFVRRDIVRALAALGRREEAEAILATAGEESRQHYVAPSTWRWATPRWATSTGLRRARARLSGAVGRADLPASRSGL